MKAINLHRGNGRDRAGVGGESGEGSARARLLDVVHTEASGEVRLGGGGWGLGNNVRAVDDLALVMAKESHLAEGSLECRLDLRLVV